MSDFKIEKKGILTLEIDPLLAKYGNKVRYTPERETLDKLKECDSFEIEIKLVIMEELISD